MYQPTAESEAKDRLKVFIQRTHTEIPCNQAEIFLEIIQKDLQKPILYTRDLPLVYQQGFAIELDANF